MNTIVNILLRLQQTAHLRSLSVLLVMLCTLSFCAYGQDIPAVPATGVVTFTPNPSSTNCLTYDNNIGGWVYNSGTVTITINNSDTEQADYLCGNLGSSFDFIQNLANTINSHSPFVVATVQSDDYSSGAGSLLLTARSGGFQGDYPIAVSVTYNTTLGYYDPNTGQFIPDFTGPATIPSAPATLTGGADASGRLFPKFLILTVVNAPPGPQSNVNFGSSTQIGTSTEMDQSFTDSSSLTISLGAGPFTIKNSHTLTQAKDSDKTISLKKTEAFSIQVRGPADGNDGINHDFDVIYLWLNPALIFVQSAPNQVQWAGYAFNESDPAHEVDVVPVFVTWLKHPETMPPGVADLLARSWAGPNQGLTSTDLANILAQDIFANGSQNIDPVRFPLLGGQTFPYEPPPNGGQPITTSFTLTYQNDTTQSNTTSTTYSVGFTLDSGAGFLTKFLKASVTASETLTWMNKAKQTNSTTTTQTAAMSLTGPVAGYQGPTDVQLYQDTLYGTFLFAFVPAPTFNLSATPGTQTVVAGKTATFTMATTSVNQFTGDVTFSNTVVGLPSGATATFDPVTIPTPGSSTLSIATSSTTPPGTYPLTITATSPIDVRNTKVTLIVNSPADFSLSISPGSQTVTAGASTSYAISTSSIAGFNSNVTFSAVSGLPAGTTAGFSPSTIGTPGASTLTVATSASTPPGTYQLTFTASGGGVSHNGSVTLVVNAADFTISASPGSQTTPAGGSTSYTINTTALGSFNGNIALSLGGLPSGASANFNPTSINGAGSSTLTVTTSTSTPVGGYTLTITGSSGALTHSTTVTLVVTTAQDFTLSVVPGSQGITVGGTATYTASTTALGGFNGNVALSVTGLPPGASATFNPASITGAGSSTLSVATSSSTPVGNYTLVVTGTSGSLSHSVSVTLTVNAAPDFTLSVTSPQPINPGQCASMTLTITSLNGFNGVVSFAVAGLPVGATASFNPPTVTGSGSTVLTICTSPSTPPGSYVITITATGGGLSHSQTVTLIVNAAPDFTMSVTPASQTITAGGNAAYTVSTTVANGFAGSVSLSLIGLPSGTSANFSPTAINGAGSATLTVTTSTTTPAGSYNLTITGISGSLTHSTTATLVVNAAPVSTTPAINSLSVNHGPCGATVTITGTNFGATQGSSTVKFNGVSAAATWGASSITVVVPDGATTGNVVVTVGGQASNGAAFTVQEDAVHIFGTNCGSCGSQLSQYTIQGSPLYGYVVQSGDVLSFYQSQAAAGGGMTLCFTNGDGSCDDDGSALDQDGERINSDNVHGVSHYRKVNLTSAAGLTLGQIIFDSSRNTPPGRWDVYFGDVQIVSADGTLHPIFINGSSPGLYRYSTAGTTQTGSAIETSHAW